MENAQVSINQTGGPIPRVFIELDETSVQEETKARLSVPLVGVIIKRSDGTEARIYLDLLEGNNKTLVGVTSLRKKNASDETPDVSKSLQLYFREY